MPLLIFICQQDNNNGGLPGQWFSVWADLGYIYFFSVFFHSKSEAYVQNVQIFRKVDYLRLLNSFYPEFFFRLLVIKTKVVGTYVRHWKIPCCVREWDKAPSPGLCLSANIELITFIFKFSNLCNFSCIKYSLQVPLLSRCSCPPVPSKGKGPSLYSLLESCLGTLM